MSGDLRGSLVMATIFAGVFLFAIFGFIALLGIVAGWSGTLILRATAVSVVGGLTPIVLIAIFLLEAQVEKWRRRP